MTQDILITPGSGEPQILFRGSGVSDTAIELNVLSSYQSASGSGTALVFEGQEGQLFAVTDNLSSGTIFSVGDITGLSMLSVDASGDVKLGEFANSVIVYPGLTLDDNVPSTVTNVLYNDGGDLKWNGITVIESGSSQAVNGSGVANYLAQWGDGNTLTYNNKNTISGNYAIVVAGSGNTSNQAFSLVGGGCNNNATVVYSTVVGGFGNSASGYASFVGGGRSHSASGGTSTIGGGWGNSASSSHAAVGGGVFNKANADSAVVAGGAYNCVCAGCSAVLGGCSNYVVGGSSAIAGGYNNTVNNAYAFAGAGANNNVTGYTSAIVGGASNVSGGCWSFIGAGRYNSSSGYASVVNGGFCNTSSGCYSAVVAGSGNIASGGGSFIGAGAVNCATGCNSVIVGGACNCTINGSTIVVGGCGNQATGPYAFIGGGRANQATGNCSFVGGGCSNTASNTYATIAGGRENTASNTYTAVGGGVQNNNNGAYATIAGGRQNHANASLVAIGGGFSHYVGGASSAIAGGYDHYVLGSYTSIGGGRSNCVMNYSYSTISGGYSNCITSNCSTIGGGCSNVANGERSTIGGGRSNVTTGADSSVVGGSINCSRGNKSFIGNGTLNITSSAYDVIAGGYSNNTTGYAGFIGGGFSNCVNGCYSVIGGGWTNCANGCVSTVAGGRCNCANGNCSSVVGGASNRVHCFAGFIGGGYTNTVSGDYSNVLGGFSNTTSGNYSSILGGQSNDDGGNTAVFILGTGITATDSNTTYTQKLNASYTLDPSGTIFNVEGSNGSIFSVVDDLSGALMSVNTIAGLPVLQVNSDYSVTAGRFNQNDFVITASGDIGMGTASPNGSLHVDKSISGGNNVYFRNTNNGSSSYQSLRLGNDTAITKFIIFTNSSTRTSDGGAGNTTIRTDSGNLILGSNGSEKIKLTSTEVVVNDNSSNLDFRVESDGNANMLFVDGIANRVGIGTASPSYDLHVKPNTSSDAIIAVDGSSNQDARLYLITNDRTWSLQNDGDGSLGSSDYFHIKDITADADRLVIDTSGNVGIGTTSPNAVLHAYGSTPSGTVFNVEGTNGSLFSVVDNLSGVLMSVNNNAGLPVFEVFDDDSIVGGRYAQNDFVITTDGDVGVGTASPGTKLEVVGSATATSFIKSGGASSQFLKADGSVDSNSYITGNQTITLTGDASGTGTTSIAVTVANDSHTHDTRYYTETEVGNFFSGSTAITGYNKSNWDMAYSSIINLSQVNDDIIPSLTEVYDIGSVTKKWYDGYFTNKIQIGDASLSVDADNDFIIDTNLIVQGVVSATSGDFGYITVYDQTIESNPIAGEYAEDAIITLKPNVNVEGSLSINNREVVVVKGDSDGSIVGNAESNQAVANYSTVSGGVSNTASGYYSTVGGGRNNYASAGYSTVGGGGGLYAGNTALGYASTVGGGCNNCASGTASSVGGGGNNCASGSDSTISGGNFNRALEYQSNVSGGGSNCAIGRHTTIGGGYCNCASACFSIVFGGCRNCSTARNSVVVGGGYNTASGCYSIIGGGSSNGACASCSVVTGGLVNITNARFSTINGGHRNVIQSPTDECCSYGATIGGGIGHNSSGGSFYPLSGVINGTIVCCNAGRLSTISGGFRNCATGNCSTIGGGACNTASGSNSTVSGGCNNTASGFAVVGGGRGNCASAICYATIGGGYYNEATAAYSTVSGGGSMSASFSSSYRNIASGTASTIGGGSANKACGGYSTVSGGYANTASGTGSTVSGGLYAKASKYGELSHASGRFAANGDAQHSTLVARRNTTDATANQVLFLNGSNQRLTIPAETTWMFEIKLAAHNDTNNDGAWWTFRGGIRRDAANGTAIIGSVIEENSKDTNMSTASASVVADDTNEALEIRVTGVASKNIRWVAVVDISQVSWGTP